MNKTFIIAEAGVNHNGSVDTAKKLIDAASESGADAVKFQTFRAENMVTLLATKAVYQKKTTEKNETQYKMVKKLELSKEDHYELFEYCKKKEIKFLSSPFDIESIEFLDSLGLDTFKIPSGEITNLPYLRKIGGLKKKVILSTGMSTIGEIKDALEVLESNGTPRKQITILHCNTEYPTSYKDVNLKAMQVIEKELNVKVGYSDHTLGIEIPIAAVVLGATVIEKHFTLDCNMEGPDHKASLEPDELGRMVLSIRNIEEAMGDGIKKPSESELKNISVVRKSIVANCKINKGEMFTENNLAVKRPGTGISPIKWDEVMGLKAKRTFEKDELVEI